MLHEKTARALANCVSPSIEIVEPREHDLTESYSSPSDTIVCEDSFGDATVGRTAALESPVLFSNTSIPNVAAHAMFPGFKGEGSPW